VGRDLLHFLQGIKKTNSQEENFLVNSLFTNKGILKEIDRHGFGPKIISPKKEGLG